MANRRALNVMQVLFHLRIKFYVLKIKIGINLWGQNIVELIWGLSRFGRLLKFSRNRKTKGQTWS